MKILLTGGAGFIGSNLARALNDDQRVSHIIILDNLSSGNLSNLEDIIHSGKIEFIEGDIRNWEICVEAAKKADAVCHQAAMGSVPRSVKDPVSTNENNVDGTLHIFRAAYEAGIKRVVYASSSSIYGDEPNLPKVEDRIGNPLSPYAVSKKVNELYANVFGSIYQMEFIGLRYFNIFGPYQSPNGPYAAVIPLFMKAALEKETPKINGDGTFSRDFTFVDNAVQANIKALFTTNPYALNQAYNVACGEQINLNQLWGFICEAAQIHLDPEYGPQREGDIPHSLADISKAQRLLEYHPQTDVKTGLAYAYDWYKKNETYKVQ